MKNLFILLVLFCIQTAFILPFESSDYCILGSSGGVYKNNVKIDSGYDASSIVVIN